MNVPKLSPEALAAVKGELPIKPLPSARNPVNRKEWVLARARCMSARLRLVMFEIDELGISLKNDWISADRAAADLAALEQLPVYVAPVFFGEGAPE